MDPFIAAVADQWLRNMTTDVTRYAVFAIAVWAGLWVILGGVLKGRKIRPDTPSARQLVTEFLISLRSVAIFSTIGLIPFVLERAGWLHGHSIATSWGPLWFWTSLALMIVAHDAYF